MRLQLAHFAHGHIIGDLCHHAQGLDVAALHQLYDGARIEVVAHDDGDLVAE